MLLFSLSYFFNTSANKALIRARDLISPTSTFRVTIKLYLVSRIKIQLYLQIHYCVHLQIESNFKQVQAINAHFFLAQILFMSRLLKAIKLIQLR